MTKLENYVNVSDIYISTGNVNITKSHLSANDRVINRNYEETMMGIKKYICMSVCMCVYSWLITFTKSLNIVEGQDTCFLTISDTD